jgi:hypothetical protein
MEFGQAYFQDIFTRILKNFISYFSDFYFIFYVFYNPKRFSRILKSEKKFKNVETILGRHAGARLQPSGERLAGQPMPPAPCGHDQVQSPCPSACGGMARAGLPVAG